MIRVFRDFLVPVLVLGAGVGATQFLFRTAPAEAEAEIVPAPLAVYATTVETVEDLAKVHTTGRVEPARQEPTGALVLRRPRSVLRLLTSAA